MPDLMLVRNLIVILLTAFAGGVAAKKLKLPVLLGFLVGGVVISSFFSRFASGMDTVSSVAEIGVALLLFTIGLEFSLTKLKNLGEVIILGSLVQVLLCIFIFMLVFLFAGIDFYSALFLASVFSLSSTALVLKTLSDHGDLETLHGEISAGILFMQDIYTLPLIILLPTIAGLLKGGNMGFIPLLSFARSLAVAFVSFFLIIFAGKRIVPQIIEKLADLKSRELLLIGAVAICLSFAYVFELLGFSFALGAFIAGILLSSSSANHGIFAEVRPLRDLFSTVFFVSLGFLVSPGFFIAHWGLILGIAVLVIFTKMLVSAVIIILLGYHSKTALMTGFSLVSVGEFAFILAMLGMNGHLISSDVYMTILSVSFISLVVSVPILNYGEKAYYGMKHFFHKFEFGRRFFSKLDKSKDEEAETLSGHVVVLGHGRVGKYICHALNRAQIPFLVVDYNHRLVRSLRQAGVKVVYGDPADIDVLHFAGVKNAKVVILAYADRHTQETVVANILTINPGVKLIARAHFAEDLTTLKNLGVDSIVQPEFEAAITMTDKLLHMVNLEEAEIEKRLSGLVREYRSSNGF